MIEAQIYDRGYRRYTGDRTGLRGAVRTLVIHSLRHALGLGRLARHKLVPILIIVAAYLPAAVFIGIAALIPGDDLEGPFLPTYAGYYGFVIAAIYLLAGFVAPQLLCTDRRSGMLGVYLASPLNRPSYLAGKAVAVLGLLLVVTFGPPLLMLIAFSLEDSGPDGFVQWIGVFFKILAGSAVMGTMFTAIALAVASTTDRVAVATATVLALMPASAVATDALVDFAELSPNFHLANLPNLPRELIFRIHGEPGLWGPEANPTWTLWLAFLFWVLGSIGVIWFQYRRLLVRR